MSVCFVFSFFFFFPLASLARISSTLLKRNSEKGHLCVSIALNGKAFSLLPLKMVLCIGFLKLWLNKSKCSPLFNLAEGFYYEWGLDFVKSFSLIYCYAHVILL